MAIWPKLGLLQITRADRTWQMILKKQANKQKRTTAYEEEVGKGGGGEGKTQQQIPEGLSPAVRGKHCGISITILRFPENLIKRSLPAGLHKCVPQQLCHLSTHSTAKHPRRCTFATHYQPLCCFWDNSERNVMHLVWKYRFSVQQQRRVEPLGEQ